jgi:hypothetical protein
MKLRLIVAALMLSAGPLAAQSDSLLTAILSDTTHVTIEVPKASVGAIRLATSSGGFVFGIVLGGFAGYETLKKNCQTCDKPQLDALVIGGAVGGSLGAALGAAFLDLSSVCAFDKRIVRTLVGAGLGASAFFVAGGGLDRGGRSIFLVPIGAVGGSLGTLGHCWKTQHR